MTIPLITALFAKRGMWVVEAYETLLLLDRNG